MSRLAFQSLILTLQKFWADRGCLLEYPMDLEVGAGTMHPSTYLKHEGVRAEATVDAGPVIFQALGSYRALRYQQVTGANAGAVTPGYGFSNDLADAYTNGWWDTRSQSWIAEVRTGMSGIRW